MNTVTNSSSSIINRSHRTRAAGRLSLLGLLALGLVLAGAGFWFGRRHQPQAGEIVETALPREGLSTPTTSLLAGLQSPIDLTLFAPKDVSALPAPLGDYVTRLESLLAEYKRVGNNKVRVSQRDPKTDAAAKGAAGAAGVLPFASENGEIVYLGLTVANGARVETIAPLAPEWEAALESDVSRAIRRVLVVSTESALRNSQKAATPPPIDPAVGEELLKAFPDLKSRAYEDAARVLSEGAMEEFKSAVLEMQAKVQLAQQNLVAARQNKSAAEQQAALKAYQQVQSEQDAKLKEIPARLQDRIVALQRLKAASAPPASGPTEQ